MLSMLMAKKDQEKPYAYFDTPDGEDVFPKLWSVLKPTFIVGLGLSTVDVLLHSKPQGYAKILGRYAFLTLPLMGMSAAFVVTTNMACNIRSKDDKINWLLGGAAAGAIFGAWRGNTEAACAGMMALSGLAVGKKHCIQNGYTIIPTHVHPMAGTIWTPKHDWTLTKDNPGAWKLDQ
ncbi:PREDICTED: NADH dehydrogenase [ubiquinone] 1 alpha subcomplex subunit 11 [Nicrophorus vespilloides]|uniref:NADH dehydrogenase [ubiquinone] 1 alpha subcomplex subunit 11 n=1 Tax=Nicrophorus vespilloides TaxID=110193 RepID=A0ABM1M1T7_NICVS|nr:PREDICTED: NADH dehydrogenase [ubiquinone] 1 alpha subcomplex subunit 11 [Nicrophorus vespilloides]